MKDYTIYFIDDDLEFLDELCAEVIFVLVKADITYKIKINPKIEDIFFEESNQLFFLDIEMPEINGLDLGKILRQRFPDCTIIYVSSHDNYVFDSFETKPFGFIRKEEFKIHSRKMLDRFFSERLSTLEFKFGNVEHNIKQNEIIYLRKFKNNVEIVTHKQVFKCRTTLEKIQNQLNEDNKVFIRIHKSIIINRNQIQKFDKNLIYLYNGEKLLISRKYLTHFKSIFYGNYLE